MIIKKIDFPENCVSLFSKVKNRKYPFFLDSGSGYENKLGKFSFIGFDPIAVFKSKEDVVEIKENNSWREIHEKDPLLSFRQFQNKYKFDHDSSFPFSGGLAGYFSYDLCHKLEKLPRSSKDDKKIPDIFMGCYDGIYVYDHTKKETYIVAHGLEEQEENIIERLEKIAITGLENHNDNIEAENITDSENKFGFHPKEFFTNFSKQEYLSTVKKVKRYIKSGDIYQVNLTQRFETEFSGDSWSLYQNLRKTNPAPFSSFFNFDDFQIVSSSPERFIKVEKGKIQTRPIKGTISRGKDLVEDRENRSALLNSEKDRSELLMIVDLARNDLGKICDTGSVVVEELFSIEEYPTLYHLVATISGVLKKRVEITDILQAAFPGGSITGTPKIRAMEIIDELEPTQRNLYTGSIGYIDFNGDMDLNIVIRTIVIKEGKAFFQVGGAVVWDSDPEAEFEETLLKGRALRKTLEGF